MKAIVDSGSTSCKWAICSPEFELKEEFHLNGINPTSNPESIEYFNDLPDEVKNELDELHFYGSGVNTDLSKSLITQKLTSVCPKLKELKLENDLLGACRATSPGKRSYVVILGTGTNACVFDGEFIGEKLPSLGYLFDDYGSGFHLGREILKKYFANKMSASDTQLFEDKYGKDRAKIFAPIYSSISPNVDIASYSRFLSESSEELRTKVCQYTFQRFLNQKIKPILNGEKLEINFVGSIAHHFREDLKIVCERNEYPVGKIMKNPLLEIVNYHKNR